MDGQVTQRITLDFSRPAVPDVVTYTQYSKVLPTIEAELYADGVPYTIPNNATVNLRIKKPTGHVVYAPATSAADNVVTYQLAAQAAAAAGMGTACIEIGTANGVLQSPIFALKIVANPMQDDAVKDTDDYKTVAEAVAAANLVNQNLDAILAAPDYAAQAKKSENQAGTYKDSAAQSAEAAADSAADAKSSAAALSSAAILTYTHRRSEGVHMLTPPAGKTAYTNAIIRFVAAADFTAGDVFYIGTTTLRGTYANGEALDTGAFVTGETVLVCRNDKKLTFKGGGGLSGADLALADAAAADVLESKTFYSGGDKLLKTGTILTHNTVDKNGAVGINSYYPTVPTTPVEGNTQVGTCLDDVNRLNLQPPAGYYDGNSYIGDTYANVAAAIGLSAAKIMSGQQVLGITGTCTLQAGYSYRYAYNYDSKALAGSIFKKASSGKLAFAKSVSDLPMVIVGGGGDAQTNTQTIKIGSRTIATTVGTLGTVKKVTVSASANEEITVDGDYNGSQWFLAVL